MPSNSQEKSDLSAKKLTERLIDRGFKVLKIKGNGRSKDRVWHLRCTAGHEFQKQGHRLWTREKCPKCHCPSIEENAARLLVEAHFSKSFPNVHPEWFTSEEGNVMEIDMYNEELKIAFEYNGKHHYEPIFGEEALAKTQLRDEYKKTLCESFGIKLIQIKAIKKNTSKKQLLESISNELAEHGIFIKEEVKELLVKESFVNTGRHYDIFTKFLDEKKFKLVDGVYENRFSRLRIMHTCGKNYSLSFKEMKKLSNRGELCRECHPEEKERSIVRQNIWCKNGLVRKEASKKRAIHIGQIICAQENWIFKNPVTSKHGHVSFVYDDNGVLSNFPLKKYRDFVTKNNLRIEKFEV